MTTALEGSTFNDLVNNAVLFYRAQEKEMDNLSAKIEGIGALNQEMRGAGMEAIRNFFLDAHKPLLLFHKEITGQFEDFMMRYMTDRVVNVDTHASCYLEDTFIVTEIFEALSKLKGKTRELTQAANRIIDSVSDIVALPMIDDSGVQTGVDNGYEYAAESWQAVFYFDLEQKNKLESLAENIHKFHQYVLDLSGAVQSSGFNMRDYKSGDLQKEKWHEELRKDIGSNEQYLDEDDRREYYTELWQKTKASVLGYTAMLSGYITRGSEYMSYGRLLTVGHRLMQDTKWSNALKAWYTRQNGAGFSGSKSKFQSSVTGYRGVLQRFAANSDIYQNARNFGRGILESDGFRTVRSNYQNLLRHQYGILDAAADFTQNSKISAIGKKLPMIGNFLTVAGNTSEFTKVENQGKSGDEKAVRFATGVAVDLGASAAGAKGGAAIGAAIGSVIAPGPGTVIGGIIGGLAGAAGGLSISSRAGDKVKDAAEKAWKGIKGWFK